MADLLQFDHITKTFPGVRALSGVSFGVAEGFVHALMGENGAGKSTLLKILSGVYRADAGTLSLGGKPQSFRNTLDALRAGVAVIYQELQLVPQLSVAENLDLGHLPNAGGWVDRKTRRERSAEQLRLLGEDIDPRVKLGSLPIGQRQMVKFRQIRPGLGFDHLQPGHTQAAGIGTGACGAAGIAFQADGLIGGIGQQPFDGDGAGAQADIPQQFTTPWCQHGQGHGADFPFGQLPVMLE